MTLIIKNVDKNFATAIKSMAKAVNAKVKIKKEKQDDVLEALKEIERGEYTEYSDFADYKKAMNAKK